MRQQLRDALGDGLISEELGAKLTTVIAPMVDIPILNKEQKEEVVRQIVSYLIVQREQDNLIYHAMKGTYVGSARLAFTKGRDMLTALAAFRTAKSRTKLANKLDEDIDVPFMPKEMKAKIMTDIVENLGELLISKIPASALEVAVTTGKEDDVERFLTTLLTDKLDVPFMSEEQKRDMLKQVVHGWLGSVDKEELKQEMKEAKRAEAKQLQERSDVMQQVGDLASKAQKELTPMMDSLASAASSIMGSVATGGAGGGRGSSGSNWLPFSGSGGSGNGNRGGGGGARKSKNSGTSGKPRKTLLACLVLAMTVVGLALFRRRLPSSWSSRGRLWGRKRARFSFFR
eukprot:TRINITY_DN1772_c0_g1_i1.p1 TRINITY_DN1772_c0_g1~~TRINITY_DN1772_c0_g1_i1.p1  ORF type:complete len:344 (-),score=71.24 TRINITY_DN1772_c0_g1_i1:120-1151(-)